MVVIEIECRYKIWCTKWASSHELIASVFLLN